jgi:hypothetical protein
LIGVFIANQICKRDFVFMNKPYKLNVFQLSNESFINFIDPEYDVIHRDSNKLVEDDSLYQSIGVEPNVNKKHL